MSFVTEGKRIASGRTEPGNTAWKKYGTGIVVIVDTSSGRFSGTPVYITSIGGKTKHWTTTGASSIYKATSTSFKIYIRKVNNAEITLDQANQYEWHINWIGMEV